MTHRLVTSILLQLLFASSVLAAAGNSQMSMRKELPLDALTNVALKSRENSYWLPDRVIVKLMPGVQSNLGGNTIGVQAIDAALAFLSVRSIEPMFPEQLARKEQGHVGLNRFYVIQYSSPVDAFSAAEHLSKVAEVHYAEPWFIYPTTSSPLFTPNDPSFASQYALVKMQVPQAWDISQGDTNVVIGIVDSGVQTAHPDLTSNIWRNPGENGLDGLSRDKRTNNLDDDNNGYVDDWQGWDLGGADYNNIVSDNNPSPTGTNNAHGTHVAGIASAATNNNTGVAGAGFKCRLLAVKTAADNDTRGPGGVGYILAGYQGITYAALMGAKVINCSWGGAGGSQVEQDLINAVTQQGSLVVCAAGNDASSGAFFPASYINVLSVAATTSSDAKAGYSNYGMTVDVAAPGSSILSTYYSNTYVYSDGTSMASPNAAGVAALVKSANPTFTALQVGERLRVTADNINSINPSYVDQLGRGRVNAFRALTENPPSIRGSNIVVRDSSGGNNNGNPEPGETIDVYVTFTNYLSPTSNTSVVLTSTSPYLTLSTNTYNLGALGTLASRRNTFAPFRVLIAANVPQGHLATMKMLITDGSYSDFQWFTILINPTYQTHNANNVVTTMMNDGRIGFNDYGPNLQGEGFKYPATSANHLFEGGIIVGTSATKLVNNVRNPGGTQDADILSRQIFSLTTPGVVSNQDGSTVYSDSLAPTGNRIGLHIRQYSYEYSDPLNDDYVLVRYEVRNISGAAISNLFFGQFYDWDIAAYAQNRTGYDATRSLAYAWDGSSTTAPYIGMRALDGAASARGLVNVSLVVDRPAKWGWISGGTGSAVVGPGDIHNVISSGPYSIAAGQTQRIGFALVGGSNLTVLQANADAARAKWIQIQPTLAINDDDMRIPERFALAQNYPNPFNPSTIIRFQIPQTSDVKLKVFDVLGREVATLVNEPKSAGSYAVQFVAGEYSSGVYYYRLTAGNYSETKKMLLVR